MFDLLQVLGLPGLGDATLDTPSGTEVFSEAQALVQRVRETGPHFLYLNPDDVYANVCLSANVEDDPDNEFDLTTVAHDFVRQPGVNVWMVEDQAYVLFAVPPFRKEEASPHGLQAFRTAIMSSTQGRPIRWGSLEDKIPLDNGVLYPKPGGFVRQESENARRYFYREMPAMLRGAVKKNTTLGKLFHSTGSLGTDETGKEVKATEEAYDLEFAKAVVRKYADNISVPQLADAIWCRRGAARRAGWQACDDLAQKVKDKQTKGGGAEGLAPARTDPASIPFDRSLCDRLHGLYFIPGQDGALKTRVEVEILYKAQIVFEYLKQRQARFYHFKSSMDVVFVVEGHHVVVDEEMIDYQNWFVENVKIFTAKDARGKNLSSALRSLIMLACSRDEPNCYEAEKAIWGLHRAETETLYLCLDANNVEMTRVRGSRGPYADIELVDNGADEVTLRGMTLRQKRFKYEECAIQKGGLKQFVDLIHDGQALPETEKFWSTVYMLTSMLPDHPQRPIKFAYGKAGSGKSTSQEDWLILMYGDKRGSSQNSVTPFCKDVAFGGPFILQDNMEESDRRPFNTVYLRFATGQTETYRRLYTTDDQAVYLPNASMVLTAIEPFGKEEHVRRSLEFEYSREYRQKNRLDPSTRKDVLLRDNDLMLSALLELFSLKVLPDYRGRRQRALAHVATLQDRLANKDAYMDFFASMLAVGEAVAPVLIGDDFNAYERFTEWMESVGAADESARIDGDTVHLLLNAIRDHALHLMDKPWGGAVQGDLGVRVEIIRGNQGFQLVIGPCLTQQLYFAFADIHKGRKGGRFPYDNPRTLRSRIKSFVNDPAFPSTGWREDKAIGKRQGNYDAWTYTFTSSDFEPLTLDEPA